MHRVRQGFVKARPAQGNQIRGLLAEFGILIPHKRDKRGPSTLLTGVRGATHPGPAAAAGSRHASFFRPSPAASPFAG